MCTVYHSIECNLRELHKLALVLEGRSLMGLSIWPRAIDGNAAHPLLPSLVQNLQVDTDHLHDVVYTKLPNQSPNVHRFSESNNYSTRVI